MKLTPYRQVARDVFLTWYKDEFPSFEEAENAAEMLSFEEVEKKIEAQSSMRFAVSFLSERLGLNFEEKQYFQAAMLDGNKCEMSECDEEIAYQVSLKMKELGSDEKIGLVLDTLSYVHNGWVQNRIEKEKSKKSVRLKFQHLPLEMIGWNEAKFDLVFVKPILEAIGFVIDLDVEKSLQEAYNKRADEFFEKNGLVKEQGLDKGAFEAAVTGVYKFYELLASSQKKED